MLTPGQVSCLTRLQFHHNMEMSHAKQNRHPLSAHAIGAENRRGHQRAAEPDKVVQGD